MVSKWVYIYAIWIDESSWGKKLFYSIKLWPHQKVHKSKFIVSFGYDLLGGGLSRFLVFSIECHRTMVD